MLDCNQMDDTLVTWLREQLENKPWSIRELGRQLNISHSHAARIVNGEARPSAKLCERIAELFDMDVETIGEWAGVMPALPPETASVRQAMRLFSQLSESDREVVLTQMRALADDEERRRHMLLWQTMSR